MPITPITLADWTTGTLSGNGAFDKLMASAKSHLDAEFQKGSIRGPEYSQVYLGQVQSILQMSLQFLLGKDKNALEAELIAQQVLLAQAQTDLVRAQIEAAEVEKDLAIAQAAKVRAETLNVPKQGLQIEAQTTLLGQQHANAILEGTVLVAQECKLRAEYDFTIANTLKTSGEIALIAQKTATEKAQTQELGVDDGSVIGKQKKLYQAQTDGFARDAEQKGAKLLIDSWNARRMTDDATVADSINMLNDSVIGAFVQKLKVGIGA